MLFYKGLEEIIFNYHETLSDQPDELIIISGYLGPSPVLRLGELPFNVKIIGGMYNNGINEKLYNSLLKVKKNHHNISLEFTTTQVHSKLYIWRKNNKILSFLIGSANFSTNGLRSDYRESLAIANRSGFSEVESYLSFIKSNTFESPIINTVTNNTLLSETIKQNEKSMVNLPLYSIRNKQKYIYPKSGLNWGFSNGHVAKGDGYIPIHKDIIRKNPWLFEPFDPDFENVYGNKKRQSNPVELIWDDGTVMQASLEGRQEVDGKNYPKQLTSFSSKVVKTEEGEKISKKSILGRYLRKRLGLGHDVPITYEHLNKYGRDSVAIKLIEPGVYECDFSIEKRSED